MEKKKQKPQEIEVRCRISDIRIEQRSEEEGSSRTVTGYAAKYETWSEPILGWFIEQISRGAFDGCDMSDAIMCFNHNIDDILARTTSGTLTLSVDDVGLHFSFEAPNTTKGNDMLELIRRGDINKCSFRFVVEQDEWVYADEENAYEYDKRTIIKIARLFDVALVVFPAYSDTEASTRKLEKRKQAYLRNRKQRTRDSRQKKAVPKQGKKPDTTQKPSRRQSPKDDAAKAQSESRRRLVTTLRLRE